MAILRIDCDASWSAVSWDPSRPPCSSGGAVDAEPIPVTPRTVLWTTETHRADPNALAPALLTFLQLPVRQLQGPAYLTGCRINAADDPVGLTPTQLRALTSTLQALQAMPDYLALHAQAGRVAATWFCPTIDGSFP